MRKASLIALTLAATALGAPKPSALPGLDALYPELEALYIDLHRHPELSLQEEKTAAKLAQRLRQLGFEVTTGVGGHGIVGLLRNGSGPTVMLRTDLDGLPMEEKTGLPFASKATAKDASGATVPVMHGCGHDLHMAAWIGAATLLSKDRASWRGTLMMVGQPAEERGLGAKAMLDDGLFTRFPKPTYAIALHDSAELPSGKIELVPGFMLANVDSVDVTIYGKGGHGAYPHKTVDPVLIAARTVVALQALVARENDPREPAVVTVGSIHGGTKHNIIPDEVHLQLTVRSYKEEVRRKLLSGIERIAKAEAQAALAPKEPKVVVSESTPATYNDPELTRRLAAVFASALGAENVAEGRPLMGAEDFSHYGRAGVSAVMFWLGAVPPDQYAAAMAKGVALPSLHSPHWAPERERSLKTGVTALVTAAKALLGKR